MAKKQGYWDTEQLESQVKKMPSGCWVWQGVRDQDNYGRIHYKGKNKGVHRVAYEMWVEPIKGKNVVMHMCDNPPCINPKHLKQGTHAENMADSKKKGRKYIGSKNPNAKLTPYQVKVIRALADIGLSHNRLSLMFAVSRRTIHNIIHGKSWEGKAVEDRLTPSIEWIAKLGQPNVEVGSD